MFQYKKAAQLVDYLTTFRNGRLTKMEAFKLVWLVDRLHVRRYGRTVTEDLLVAMEHGPVPSSTKSNLETKFRINDPAKYFGKILKLNGNDIFSVEEPDMKVFSKSEIKVISDIMNVYGKMPAKALRDISHEYPEWKRFEEGLQVPTSFPMVAQDFFGLFDDGNGVFNQDEGTLKVMMEEYLENN